MTEFQSTLPVWGATVGGVYGFQISLISIHAPRVGSDQDESLALIASYISIHAPRVGSDSMESAAALEALNFNPRSPCGERQRCNKPQTGIGNDFNPRSPCGERPQQLDSQARGALISIHAPRVGSDYSPDLYFRFNSHFNPRSPCGERPQVHMLTT